MKKHILLIDDDKDELDVFLDALRTIPHEDGFKCTFASSTVQALEMLKFLVPQYIFVDFNIPKMNGIEFLGFVKKQPHLQNTRLCLYSVHISEEANKMATDLGASCIKKAGTIDALAKELISLFAGTQPPQTPPKEELRSTQP